MTVLATIPWAELLPCPELPVVAALSFALSLWYGYRHPKGY